MNKTEINEKHEVFIKTHFNHVWDKCEPKEGELVFHNQKIDKIIFYQPVYGNYGVVSYRQVALDRDFIMDIAAQIKAIESPIHRMPYEPVLPF